VNHDTFLDELERAVMSSDSATRQDLALYYLLRISKDYLPPLDDPHWFHKAFRQTDMTPSAAMDMAIWNLLAADAPLVWKHLQRAARKIAKGAASGAAEREGK
jgi:hypothetical protein